MATYNNEAYLAAMLDSLLDQTSNEFRLIVSDDCSHDSSVSILRHYRRYFGGRMDLRVRPEGSGSAKANFAGLMEMSTADYVLFADADDVWHQDKISRTVAALQDVESVHGVDTPAFVFSDARLIDGDGSPIGDSYWRFKKIRPSIAQSLSGLLVCPPMLGCASGANAALLRCASPLPIAKVTGHDWWMILVANIFGQARAMHPATMDYRLHDNNSSAQKVVSMSSYARSPGKKAAVRLGMQLRRDQAEALIDRFGDDLPSWAHQRVEDFVRTKNQNFLRRRLTLLAGGYLYRDLPRNVAMLALS